MNINKIAQTVYQKQTEKGKARGKEKDFAEDFLGSLKGKMAGGETEISDKREDNALLPKEISENGYLYGASSRITVLTARSVTSQAVSECGVRGISYEQCDYVKICIEEGYVYKAQVDKEKESVYVEEKREDGQVKGYEADPNKIDEDTENNLEHFVLEAWRKALNQYTDYVQERIKNGPEKFRTGGSEFTLEEWDKLMEKIDKDIDMLKEEQKERLEKEAAKAEAKELLKEQEEEDGKTE
ncbi:MAG: hypothetical protein NC086_04805 [Alistipes sp.]|nr:hypothetical protein [Alistipes sp.]